jgi:hypothetical protein
VVTLTQGSVTLWYLVGTRTKEVLEEIIKSRTKMVSSMCEAEQ